MCENQLDSENVVESMTLQTSFFMSSLTLETFNVVDDIPFTLRLCQHLDYFHTRRRLPAPWFPDFLHQWSSSPCRPSPVLQLQLRTILHAVGSFGGLLPASFSLAGKRATWPHPEACTGIKETLMTDFTWHFLTAVWHKAVKKHFYIIDEELMLLDSRQKERHQQYVKCVSGRVEAFCQVVLLNILVVPKLDRTAKYFKCSP